MDNYLKEIKAILIFTLAIILIFGSVFVLDHFEIENYFYAGVLGYLVLCAILAVLSSVFNSNFLDKIARAVLVPGEIILSIGSVLLPFAMLVFHVLLYVAIVILIPIAFLKGMEFLGIVVFNNTSALTYFKFTSAVFIAVLLNFQIRQLIYMISPARIRSSQKLRPYELDKLTDYLLSEMNVRFLIYGLYVVLLLITNFHNFENLTLTDNLPNDKAILQSFVTFIAFDRLLALLKKLDFKPSDLLERIGKSINNKLKDLERQQE